MDIDDREARSLRAVAEARSADVHALRAVEARLSRALQRSIRLLDHVADGIYGLDVGGRVEFVNRAAARITGHPAPEQLGADQHALIHDRRPDGSPYPVEDCPVWQALRTGRTVHAPDETFWRSDGTPVPVDLVVVPTLDRGAVSGVVVSFRDLTERRAAERQAAELRRVQQEAATQRALADRLQDAMLTPPPTGGDLEIAVRYRAAVHEAHIGGDWYDAFVEPDGSTVLAIGDVVGHDSRAAVAMGQLRGLLRALAYDNGAGPAATLTRAEHVAGGLGVSTMATVLLARVEPAGRREGGRRLCWSNAGHLPPLLLRPDGSSAYLEAPPDLVLGIDPDTPREEHEAFLPDGATLLLCTDGLVERRDWDLDQGLATLRATVADLAGVPLEQFCDTVLRRLVPTAGADDVAMVAVRSRSGGHGRPSVTPGG